MTTIVTTTVNNGDVTDADVMNANFTSVKTAVNGNLENENISATAAIGIAKLAGYPGDGTKVLQGDGTWGTTAASGTGYAVGLPASPTDGQEYILVDSVTLATYQWRFRYNAGSSNTDKWEFIGGAPVYAAVETSQTTTSTSYAALATAGPTITVPRAGVYRVEFGCNLFCNAAVGNTAVASYDVGAVAATDADSISAGDASSTGQHTVSRMNQHTGITASTAFTMKYKVTSNTGTFKSRWMAITPVRVS